MQGQSPYLVNAGIFFNSDLGKPSHTWQKGWTASLLYNTIGKRIIGVGRSIGSGETDVRVPDSYEMPRHQIDLNLGKSFGRLDVRLSVRDLQAQQVEFKQFEQTAHGEIEQVTRAYQPGRSSLMACFNSVAMGYPIGLIIDGEKGNTQEVAKAGKLKLQNIFMAGMGITGSDANKRYTDDLYDAASKSIIDANKESYSSTFFKAQHHSLMVSSHQVSPRLIT